MAGHSKWANIKHKKERQDAKRGKIFTKIIREITGATKQGGPDTNTNSRLRMAIDKAINVNMPKDTIQRASDKGIGAIEGGDYIELRYEGYGPGGSAVIVECLTDNKTRTIAEIRHIFSKYGAHLGTDGSVSFQFKRLGYLLFAADTNEDALLEAALEYGADDVIRHDDIVEVTVSPSQFSVLKDHLANQGFRAQEADITMRADNEVLLNTDDAKKMQVFIDALEELDGVQEVHTSALLDF